MWLMLLVWLVLKFRRLEYSMREIMQGLHKHNERGTLG